MAVLMPRSVPQRVRAGTPPPARLPAEEWRRRSILAPGAPDGEARIRCVRRRFGLALGLVLAGLALLVAGPFDLGAVRVAGVSLLWWYGGAVAPVLAALLTLALFPSGRSPRR
jgi:hypothetical protein